MYMYVEKIFPRTSRFLSGPTYTDHAIKNDLGDRSHLQQFTTLPKFLSVVAVHLTSTYITNAI